MAHTEYTLEDILDAQIAALADAIGEKIELNALVDNLYNRMMEAC